LNRSAPLAEYTSVNGTDSRKNSARWAAGTHDFYRRPV
jgi:hypothetical protein